MVSRRVWGAALLCAWVSGLAACATGSPPAPPPPDWTEARTQAAERLERLLAAQPGGAPGVLELRLAFGGQADLDLYVTGPTLETLYYANTPIRSGGELLEDQRCAAERGDADRVEVVRFATPLAGRYRVGVDHPSSCSGDADVVPYVLSIDSSDGRKTLRGLSKRLRFDPIVIEFDWP